MEFREMRRKNQAISEEECIEVLRTSKRGVLAMHGENGYPYAIPINQYYDPTDGNLYFHGAKEGLKLDLLKEDSHACFTIIDEGFRKEGEWPLNFRSVIVLGRVSVVEDHDKVIAATRRLAEKFYPDQASIDAEIKKAASRVNMLCLTIDRISGKLVNES